MARTARGDDEVGVPANAEFFHIADVARDGDDAIVPVSIMAAQPGDLVVHAGSQVGIYAGGGKMRRQTVGDT